jgi:transposase
VQLAARVHSAGRLTKDVSRRVKASQGAASGDLVRLQRTLFVWRPCGIRWGMKPLFVRELSDPERQTLQAGLRSSDGFTVRRCHILLASARGDTAPLIAQAVGCTPQAVRNVLRAFETRGLAVVALQSRRPHTAAKVFDAERSQRLKALLHQSPRQFGKARSTWTLALAAEVCAEHGITAERVSYETIRDALKRLDVGWRRAKTWITSPDPQYALKKTGATA